ncbi:MAG TPA: hypothetical protein VF636_05340 [Sphingomonas sp.]|jgi:hypothetical protein
MNRLFGAFPVLCLLTAACGSATQIAAGQAGPEKTMPKLERPALHPAKKRGDPATTTIVDGQPYGGLDEYLAKLERDGFVGKAWYREVRPGMYELVTNLRPPPEKRLFTRAELEREFGFAK